MRIFDPANTGYLPLQHYLPEGSDIDIPMRRALYAVRMKSAHSDDGFPEIEDDSGGDIRGAVLWKTLGEERQKLHSHWFAAPSVTTEPVKAPGQSKDAGKTFTRADVASETKPRTVKVRPPENDKWEPDERYDEIKVVLPKGVESMPKGTPGLIVDSSSDEEEHRLFFPAAATPLVAVNLAGDPADGSLVFDHDKDDPEKLSEDFKARLQSMMRVVRPGASCVGGAGPSLAWQGAPSGQDNLMGLGITVFPGGGKGGGSPEPTAPEAAKDVKPPRPMTGPGSTAGEDSAPRHGKVTTAGEWWEDTLARLNAGSPADPDETTIIGGVTVLGPNGQALNSGGTRERPRDGTQERPKPKLPPAAGPDSGLIVGLLSTAGGGPLGAGSDQCQHRIGMTLDGEAINAGHLGADSLIYKSDQKDGPWDFDEADYTATDEGPLQVKAHIRFDPARSHDWKCGSGVGKWAVQSSSYWAAPPIPPKKPPPKHPPPPEDEELILVPSPLWPVNGRPMTGGRPQPDGGFISIPTHGTRPGSTGVTIRGGRSAAGLSVDDLIELELTRILSEGLPADDPAVVYDPTTGDAVTTNQQETGSRPKYAATPGCAEAAGVAIRANATSAAAPDVNNMPAGVSPEMWAAVASMPIVASLVGYAAGTGEPEGFTYGGGGPTDPGAQPTGAGGVVVLPGGTSLNDAMNGVAGNCPAGQGSKMVFLPALDANGTAQTKIAFGTPDQTLGCVVNGFSIAQNNSGGLDIFVVDETGAESSSISIDSAGTVSIPTLAATDSTSISKIQAMSLVVHPAQQGN